MNAGDLDYVEIDCEYNFEACTINTYTDSVACCYLWIN